MKRIFFTLIIFITLSCSGITNIFIKERATTFPYKTKIKNELYYLLTDDEKSELKNCKNNLEVMRFYNRFWLKRDPTPNTAANENKKTYDKRLKYVNEHFKDLGEGWQTDRGRVIILYGFPDQIIVNNFSNIDIGIQKINHFEIWIYNTPSQYIGNRHLFSNIERGKTKFIFADINSLGIYKQIFSTEKGEKIDPRIYFSLFDKPLLESEENLPDYGRFETGLID